jgi:methylphosphotriester-DNA--protein-cysteine methyltransferase
MSSPGQVRFRLPAEAQQELATGVATVSSKLQTLPPRLDWATCDRARLAGDRAFDGLFLTGVRSTRIYCRPVCPVRPARSENVTFYATAAAAERAGFRPCLRRRPEAAPGSPAWMGTATTVARGMRMIEEGFLDRGSVAGLARRSARGRAMCCVFSCATPEPARARWPRRGGCRRQNS